MAMKEIRPEDWNENVFRTVGKDWLLITAGDEKGLNAMTASWGLFGELWGEHVAEVFIRPSRYTKEFVDAKDYFSLSVLPEELHKTHAVFGSLSGRDVDKTIKTGLTPVFGENAPYYAEARLVMILKKFYAEPFKGNCFTDPEPDEACYPEKDYHTLYIGRIEKILING